MGNARIVKNAAIANAYARASDFFGAVSVLEHMQQYAVSPNAVIYGCIFQAAKNAAGRDEHGQLAVARAQEIFEELEPEFRNGHIYASLLRSLGKLGGRKAEAEALYKQAKEEVRPWPSSHIYDAAFEAVRVPFGKELAADWIRECAASGEKRYGRYDAKRPWRKLKGR